jgi:hypothetical protein
MTKMVKIEYEPTNHFFKYNVRIRIWGEMAKEYINVEVEDTELELIKGGGGRNT